MPDLPPATTNITFTESGTTLYAETNVIGFKRIAHFDKADPNFDMKLGQFVRIACRQNFDINYNPGV